MTRAPPDGLTRSEDLRPLAQIGNHSDITRCTDRNAAAEEVDLARQTHVMLTEPRMPPARTDWIRTSL
jgi:hypothetical protein